MWHSRFPRRLRVYEYDALQNYAPSGETVQVPRFVRPYEVLQIAANAPFHEIKESFRRSANHSSRQKRAMASLAYIILASKDQRYKKTDWGTYEITDKNLNDVIVLAAIGATTRLLAQIRKNKGLLTSIDEHKHTLLYLTARSGYYDTTEALLKMGVQVNETQVDDSTALHVAVYYGQRGIVGLLLEYGAHPAMINRWGNTPTNEASSEKIKQDIQWYKDDRISQIVTSLIEKQLVRSVRLVKRRGKLIGKEILRHENTLDVRTRNNLDFITSKWVALWHGTKSSNIESILRYGLLPSGTKLQNGLTIKPPNGHIRLGVKHFGFDDWAKAIFLSPSIAYASNSCYSEHIWSSGENWCILIKALVEPTSYTKHDPTLLRYNPIEGEPEATEYRIQVSEGDTIMRVESGRHVVVRSIVFISLDFLQKTPNLHFEELMSCFDHRHLF